MRPRSMLPLALLALLLLPAPSSAQTDAANGTAAAEDAAEDVLPAPAEDGDDADFGAAGEPLAFRTDISPCDADEGADCWLEGRNCYRFVDGRTECGSCLDGYLEYGGSCYFVDEIGTAKFARVLTALLGRYLPEYADPSVSAEERAGRLRSWARAVGSWNSRVPPPAFRLGLNMETFLTPSERLGRLGNFLSNVTFVDTVQGRGALGRFRASGDEGRRLRRFEGRRGLGEVPDAVDWHDEGYTTRIKNQGICGCCWAVSTAAAVESALMITGQTPRYDKLDGNSLSFQQMISCDTKNQNGCGGGNIMYAAKYVWQNDDFDNGKLGGLLSYRDYKYDDFLGMLKGPTDPCDTAGKVPSAYLNFPQVVNSVNDRTSYDKRKTRLMEAVAQQPVSSVLKSNCDLLMSYEGGVMTTDDGCQCCEASCIDHAVVIVGYNATAPVPYWKLRNSWGVGWGEDGHFRIAMEPEGCGWGLFGMLAEASLPSEAYATLDELPERPGWWATSTTAAKVLVVLSSTCLGCCLFGMIGLAVRKRMRGGDDNTTEGV